MDPYRSEEDQIRALREWWKHNGSSTLIGVGLALALVFGWQWWQQRGEQRADESAMLYRQLLEAAGNAAGDPVQQATALHLAGELREARAGTRFADYATLLLARLQVEKDDLPAAEAELRPLVERLPVEAPGAAEAWVRARLGHAVDPQLGVLARVRLARVLHAQGKDDEALGLLGQGDAELFHAEREELRGDILLAKGDRDGARAAYAAAIERARRDGTSVRLLELKKGELERDHGDPT